MKIATVTLASVAPYSQSRAHETPKNDRERPDDYEARTWREKCHYTPEGNVFIPPMSLKMGLDTAAKMLGMQIPGRGKSTFTKFFLSGCLVMDPVVLPVSKADVACDRIYANADGIRGSGKRVWRMFPRVDSWEGKIQYHILADEITKDVFEEHLKQAGAFVGIGRFRPQSGGYYGRYEVKKIAWN